MPLNKKGKKILRMMKKEYGVEKGKQVFYASENSGKITGVTSHTDPVAQKAINKLPKV
jgi:hypothetical protein